MDIMKIYARITMNCRMAIKYLVKVTKEFITTNELADKVNVSKFVVGNYH